MSDKNAIIYSNIYRNKYASSNQLGTAFTFNFEGKCFLDNIHASIFIVSGNYIVSINALLNVIVVNLTTMGLLNIKEGDIE